MHTGLPWTSFRLSTLNDEVRPLLERSVSQSNLSISPSHHLDQVRRSLLRPQALPEIKTNLLSDQRGNNHTVSDFKLEWISSQCYKNQTPDRYSRLSLKSFGSSSSHNALSNEMNDRNVSAGSFNSQDELSCQSSLTPSPLLPGSPLAPAGPGTP